MLLRRFGSKDAFTSMLGGAFGAAAVMGAGGFVLVVAVPYGQDDLPVRLSNAWVALHILALLGAIGGAVVGLAYAVAARLVNRLTRPRK